MNTLFAQLPDTTTTTKILPPTYDTFDAEINMLEYEYDDRQIPYYNQPTGENKGKVPYIPTTFYTGGKFSLATMALADSGSERNIISERFFNLLPEEVRNTRFESTVQYVGTASNGKLCKVIGEIKLSCGIKSNNDDRYPLLLTHLFLIAKDVTKDCYFGVEYLLNPHSSFGMLPTGLNARIVDGYPFPIDPNDVNGIKFIPFVYLGKTEAIALNTSKIEILGQETAIIQCSLTHRLQGQKVRILNTKHTSLSMDTSVTNAPVVKNEIFDADADNQIFITVHNYSNTKITLRKNAIIAVVQPLPAVVDLSQPSTSTAGQEPQQQAGAQPEQVQRDDRNTSPKAPTVIELNELIFDDYSIPHASLSEDKQLHSSNTDTCEEMDLNHVHFVDNDPVLKDLNIFLPHIVSTSQEIDVNAPGYKQLHTRFNFNGLSPEVEIKLITVMYTASDAFASSTNEIRKCTTHEHRVQLARQTKLPKKNQIPTSLIEPISKRVEDLIEVGIIERGREHTHFSNLVPIQQIGEPLNLAIDLICLNQAIHIPDELCQFDSPYDLLYRLFQKKIVVSCSFHEPYYHIPIAQDCLKYYGVYSHRSFQDQIGFCRATPADKSAVYTYNKILNDNFDHMRDFLFPWNNKIFITANSYDELCNNLTIFLEKTNEIGFCILPESFTFYDPDLKYFGFDIDLKKDCSQINAARLQFLDYIAPPISHKDFQKLLKSLRIYNNHVPEVKSSLEDLEQERKNIKSSIFRWTGKCQELLLKFKAAIARSILSFKPTKTGTYQIYTDASNYSYSSCIFYKADTPNTPKVLIGAQTQFFFGDQLQNAIYYKELLAVMYAITYWMQFINGSKAELYTDCKSLLYCAQAKSDHLISYRFAMILSSLNLSFHHVKGTDNLADLSSRPYQAYLIQGLGRIKPRSKLELANSVDDMTVKEYYSPEEVKTLLIHNQKAPISQERINACNKKLNEILSNINFDKPVVKSNCCDDCELEIHNFQVSTMQYVDETTPLVQDQLYPSIQPYYRPRKDVKDKHFLPYLSHAEKLDLQENAEMGMKIYNHFMTVPEEEIFVYDPDIGYSFNPYPEKVHEFDNPESNNHLSFPSESSFTISDQHKCPKPEVISNKKFQETIQKNTVQHPNPDKHAPDSENLQSLPCENEHNLINCSDVKTINHNFPINSQKEEKETFAQMSPPSFEINLSTTVGTEYDEQQLSAEAQPFTQLFRVGQMTLDQFILAQNEDFKINRIIRKLKTCQMRRKQTSLSRNYCLIKGLLFKRCPTDLDKIYESIGWKIYVPNCLIPFLLRDFHAPAEKIHVQCTAMENDIKMSYYFPHMNTECAEYARSCQLCAFSTKDTRRLHRFGRSKPTEKPLSHLLIDFAVSLPPTPRGNQHILVCMCAHTRYVTLIPTKSRSGPELAESFFKIYIPAFGAPQQITADNEKSFHAGPFHRKLTALGTKFSPTIAYRPMAAGKIESAVNRTKSALTTFANAKGDRTDWDLHLPMLAQGINNSYHASIKQNPFHALMCFNRNRTWNLIGLVKIDPNQSGSNPSVYRVSRRKLSKFIIENDEAAIAEQLKTLNKNTIIRKYKNGSKVMRKVFYHRDAPAVNRSLKGNFVGPYTVLKDRISDCILINDSETPSCHLFEKHNCKRICLKKKSFRSHKNHLKKFVNSKNISFLPLQTWSSIQKLKTTLSK